jgi:hypothetical protein
LRFWEGGIKVVDPGVIAAIIGALSAAAVVVLTAHFGLRSYTKQKSVDRENYAAEKEIDRENELRNQRRKEYERYLTAYRGVASLYDFDPPPADNSEVRIKAVHEYWLAYSKLFNIASDPVLLAVTEYHKFEYMQDHDLTGDAYEEKFKQLYATMIIEMRKDTTEETELQQDLIEERLPFNFSRAREPANANQPE